MSTHDRFDSDDIEAIDKYWQERPQSFSAKVLEELLAGGPAEQVLPLPKTPGARIAVARTVMAASDQKIRDLQDALNTMKSERDRSFATWVAVAINKPLFAKGSDPASTEVKAIAETEQKKLDEDEYRFFLRYLTLRNILAFIVVSGGIIGSVFVYSVSASEKHASNLELNIKDLTTQNTQLESKKTELQGIVNTLQGECGPQLGAKKAELEQANKLLQQANVAATQNSKNLADAQAAATRSDQQANQLRQDLAVLQQRLNDLQNPPKK